MTSLMDKDIRNTQYEPKNRTKKRANLRKQKLLVYIRRPETVFEPYPNPKNSPLGPQKVKNDPQIKSESKVRIKETIENENCSPT